MNRKLAVHFVAVLSICVLVSKHVLHQDDRAPIIQGDNSLVKLDSSPRFSSQRMKKPTVTDYERILSTALNEHFKAITSTTPIPVSADDIKSIDHVSSSEKISTFLDEVLTEALNAHFQGLVIPKNEKVKPTSVHPQTISQSAGDPFQGPALRNQQPRLRPTLHESSELTAHKSQVSIDSSGQKGHIGYQSRRVLAPSVPQSLIFDQQHAREGISDRTRHEQFPLQGYNVKNRNLPESRSISGGMTALPAITDNMPIISNRFCTEEFAPVCCEKNEIIRAVMNYCLCQINGGKFVRPGVDCDS